MLAVECKPLTIAAGASAAPASAATELFLQLLPLPAPGQRCSYRIKLVAFCARCAVETENSEQRSAYRRRYRQPVHCRRLKSTGRRGNGGAGGLTLLEEATAVGQSSRSASIDRYRDCRHCKGQVETVVTDASAAAVFAGSSPCQTAIAFFNVTLL